MTVGYVMSGYSSIARRVYETTPSTTSATIIMVANTGRLMLTSERNMEPLWWLRRSGAGYLHAHPASERTDVADDDPVALGETAQHLGAARALIDDPELHVDLAENVSLEAVDEGRPALVLAKRGGRDEKCFAHRASDDASGRKAATLEASAFVGHLDVDRDRAAGWVDGGTHARDAAL